MIPFQAEKAEAYTCTDVLFVGGEKVRVHVSKNAPLYQKNSIFYFLICMN